MVEAKDSALTSGTPMENDSIKISTRFGSVERPRSTNHAPNGSVTSGQIVNFSAEDLRRVIISVTASYDSATEDVRAACLDAIGMIDKALSDPPPFAAISSYGSSSIEYTVRTWCKTEDYWDVYFALNENLRTCFEKHGVEMCYDHLNVHLVNDK